MAGTRPCAPARVTAWTPGGARRPRRASPPCAWGSAREEMWPAAQRRHGSWRCTVSVPGEPSQRVRHAPRPWNGRRGRRASRARLACSVAEGGVFLAARSRPPPSAAHAPSWDSAPMGCCFSQTHKDGFAQPCAHCLEFAASPLRPTCHPYHFRLPVRSGQPPPVDTDTLGPCRNYLQSKNGLCDAPCGFPGTPFVLCISPSLSESRSEPRTCIRDSPEALKSQGPLMRTACPPPAPARL